MKKILNIRYILLPILLFAPTKSLSTECDTSLKREEGSVGYQIRNNERCEGFYVSQVSSGSLDVVGVTQGEFKFKYERKEILTVSSPIVKDKSVNIQAVGIPLKTYYRMDATIAPNGSLRWPVGDILYPQKLKYNKIGTFGWIGSKSNKTFVPLKVTSVMLSAPENNTIYVYLRASIDVMKVKWRFAAVAENGKCAKADKWIVSKKKIYRSGDRIVCKVPDNWSGETCLTVRAEALEGDDSLVRNVRIILK